MKVFTTIESLQTALAPHREKGSEIGFIPTMGALHKGHISLLHVSLKKDSISVVSIFVNPTQFNDENDLNNYPRTFNKDCDLLKSEGCHIVFAPSEKEMYPEPDNRKFDFGNLELVMEGKHRPGHFNGVSQIVSKLFNAVQPHRSYFGQKDFQQLSIIRKMVDNYNYQTEVIACPIIREKDGLAMSSRNRLLEPKNREAAALIFKVLQRVETRIKVSSVEEVEGMVERTINANPFLQLEYFHIVDNKNLNPISNLQPKTRATACIAVFSGKVRLIDNIDIIL